MNSVLILFKLLPLLSLLLSTQPLPSHATLTRSSTRHLADTALTASAVLASETSAYVSRVSSDISRDSPRSDETNAFQDCAGMMAHCTDRLQLSVREMSRLGPRGSPAYSLHLNNLQTWVSSALTDEEMCIDALSRVGGSGESGRVAAAVRMKVEGVRKHTRAALALVNRLS